MSGLRSHWPNADAARPIAIRAAVLRADVDPAVVARVEVRAVRVDVRADRADDRATARVTTGSPATRPPRRRTRRPGPRSR